MISELHRRAPNTSLTPIIIIRWFMAFGQLMVLMASEALWGKTLPAGPMLVLIAAAAAFNLYAMTAHKGRPVPEETIRLHILFDILQLTGVLYLTGGLGNPFRLLLLCPLALAASLLSLFNVCLMILLTITCASVISFSFIPLDWMGSPPYASVRIQQMRWIPLTLTVIMVSFIIWRLAASRRQISEALQETQAILASKQRDSALGALAAAAVHELGSPLSTIAVVTREMERDILPDDPLADDIALLKTQSDKCKKILADIARDPTGTALMRGPLRIDRFLLELAGSEQTAISIQVTSHTPENLPSVRRTPNLEYGLGNLINNAASFSRKKVLITTEATASDITVTIEDDGPGFGPEILRQIGMPYISSRENRDDHMGLGIFIAVNLLEASGARLVFSNSHKGGGFVRITWPRAVLELEAGKKAD